MNRVRIVKLGLVTLLAGGLAAATVFVTASAAGVTGLPFAASPAPSNGSSPGAGKARVAKYCDAFVGHVAGNLGKSSNDVKSAMQKAAGQTIDDAVKGGDLTKAQGDALKQKLANNRGSICAEPLVRAERGAFGGFRPAGYMKEVEAAAAKSLGISSDELTSDLAKGMTLHQIADSKQISVSDFRNSLITNLTPALDQAVKDGKITKDQETEIINKLKTGPIPLWDRPVNKRPRAGASQAPTPSS
jgi:polyhydroxyalkanoate synthesis regulator phasin